MGELHEFVSSLEILDLSARERLVILSRVPRISFIIVSLSGSLVLLSFHRRFAYFDFLVCDVAAVYVGSTCPANCPGN